MALRSYELKVENIAVPCDLDPNLPKTTADPYQLQQVILSLVINAEQAIVEGRGQGDVWIETRCVQRHDGDRIAIEIADGGPGIPPETAYRMFDPFFTTKPPGVGTGLGLSIVYGIVHQHGGEVTFSNQQGLGARFVVELPVVAAQAEELPATSSRPSISLASRDKPEVIILEDRIFNGAPLAEALAECAAVAPVILIAAYEQQGEVARMIAAGQVEFVPRANEWAPLAASLIERRLPGRKTRKRRSPSGRGARGGYRRDFSARDQQPADGNSGQRGTLARPQRQASCRRNAKDSHGCRTCRAPSGNLAA